jgi:hypothetical protein
MFVEGQWWARDIQILEPINWDKHQHLCITHHEYPPIVSCDGMKGSSNGDSWDPCAARTKYNIPIWHGETGEQGPPYSRNIQSTDFLNANNIGYAWWCEKKFNSQNAPWNCPKTSGFNSVLSYWNGGAKPSATDAKNWLFDQARRTALSYCTFNPNMVASLHPLDPNGKVGVKDAAAPVKPEAARLIVSKANSIAVELPLAQHFTVTVVDMRGKIVFQAAATGTKLAIASARFPSGLYVVRLAGEKTSARQCVVVSHK